MTDNRFSRDTFKKINHYVSVRLKQGVPLVDADWNEKEDIRKYELQAFLKWFVGNGVPAGNDGFHILPAHQIAFHPLPPSQNTQASVEIDTTEDELNAAPILGFDQQNSSKSGSGDSIRLIGKQNEPFCLLHDGHDGMFLRVKINNGDWQTITFQSSDFVDIASATSEEVATVIIKTFELRIVEQIPVDNDFVIKGGDGTTDGAGRCLVEGLDVFNEHNLSYKRQALYGRKDDQWGIQPKDEDWASQWGFEYVLQELPPPSMETPDTIYLDVWEREVDAKEDTNLVNEYIRSETCVRWKREWVVRIAPRTPKENFPKQYTDSRDRVHFLYPLAERQIRFAPVLLGTNFNDLRRTDLQMLSPHESLSLSGQLNFVGEQYRQMINLRGSAYGIGVQKDTQYFRTASDFAWFKGGTHSNKRGNPGKDGTLLMAIAGDGNVLTLNNQIGQSIFTLDAKNNAFVLRNKKGADNVWIHADPANGGSGITLRNQDGTDTIKIDGDSRNLHISGGNGDLDQTEGDLTIGSTNHRLKIGVVTDGASAGDVRIRAHAQGGSNRLMLGSGTRDVLTLRDSNVGIGTTNPTSSLHILNGDLKIEAQTSHFLIHVDPPSSWQYGESGGSVSLLGSTKLTLGVDKSELTIQDGAEVYGPCSPNLIDPYPDDPNPTLLLSVWGRYKLDENTAQTGLRRLMAINSCGDLILSARTDYSKCRALVDSGPEGLFINYRDHPTDQPDFPKVTILKPKLIDQQNGCSRELKENVVDLSSEDAMAAFEGLNPVKFNYKSDSYSTLHLGFIAEDVPDLLASLDRTSIGTLDIVAVLTKVVQEQQRTISALSEKVQFLENNFDKTS